MNQPQDAGGGYGSSGDRPTVTRETLRRHQAYYAGDREGWQREARLLQSLWRQRRGLPPGGAEDHAGSTIGADAEPAATGAAYLSEDARRAVRAALREKQRGAVLQKGRLWSNLLSSQPLCFNVFGPLSEHPEDPRTLRALRVLWPDIKRVLEIRYEYSPGRGDRRFLANRTAFDVFIRYRDTEDAERFIGIEMKYHEDLRGKPPEIRGRALSVLRTSGAFRPTATPSLATGSTAQLLLDHLLALSMNLDDDSPNGRFVVLYPARNQAVARTVADYITHLAPGDTSFSAITLELVVDAWRQAFDEPWVEELYRRYLDVAQLEDFETAER